MSFSEDDRRRIADMVSAARHVTAYVTGYDLATFLATPLTQDAVIWQITIIGEAANHVSQQFIDENPSVPWRAIIAMRNLLIHTYRAIDLEEVWNTATVDVPALIAALEPLLPPPPAD